MDRHQIEMVIRTLQAAESCAQQAERAAHSAYLAVQIAEQKATSARLEVSKALKTMSAQWQVAS